MKARREEQSMRNRTQRREATTHTQTIVSTQTHQGEVKLKILGIKIFKTN